MICGIECQNPVSTGNDLYLVERIKACKTLESLRSVHVEAIQSGHDSNKFVANTLVDMYAKRGSMADAREVFERMETHDVVSWNALMFGYAVNGEEWVTFELLELMSTEGCRANARSFVAALKACTCLASKEDAGDKKIKLRSLAIGMSIHFNANSHGCDSNLFVESTLVDMYSKCRSMVDAQNVFDNMAQRNVASWNALLFGHAENGEESTIELFERMEQEGCEPTARSFVAVLNACSRLALKEEAVRVNEQLMKFRTLERAIILHFVAATKGYTTNTYLSSTLVDVYSKCGSMVDAGRILRGMQRPDIAAWNALLLGYIANGQGNVALDLLPSLQCAPDALTCAAALKACIVVAEKDQGKPIKQATLEKGLAIHSHAVNIFYHLNKMHLVNTSLITMYGKCGSIIDAQMAFDMSNPDIVSWNALLFAYIDNGKSETALKLFGGLQNQGFIPDELTFVAALKACGTLVALEAGKHVHTQISKSSFHCDPFVTAALVDFYGKCGNMLEAEQVFASISRKDLVSWNTLIAGYSLQSDSKSVFDVFERMRDAGTKPDYVTFLCMLSACSHAGLVDKGKEYFAIMSSKYGISPRIEHYSCLIGLLVRANELVDAVQMLNSMPFEADAVLWMTLLGACTKCKNAEVGKVAFDALFAMHLEDATPYVLMANIYESLGMTKEKAKVEESLKEVKFLTTGCTNMQASR